MKVLKNLDDSSSSIEDIFADDVNVDNYPNYVPDPDEPHLLHPGQKGTILFKAGLFQPTIDQLITKEEGAPVEACLDQAMNIYEEDEEQAM